MHVNCIAAPIPDFADGFFGHYPEIANCIAAAGITIIVWWFARIYCDGDTPGHQGLLKDAERGARPSIRKRIDALKGIEGGHASSLKASLNYLFVFGVLLLASYLARAVSPLDRGYSHFMVVGGDLACVPLMFSSLYLARGPIMAPESRAKELFYVFASLAGVELALFYALRSLISDDIADTVLRVFSSGVSMFAISTFGLATMLRYGRIRIAVLAIAYAGLLPMVYMTDNWQARGAQFTREIPWSSLAVRTQDQLKAQLALAGDVEVVARSAAVKVLESAYRHSQVTVQGLKRDRSEVRGDTDWMLASASLQYDRDLCSKPGAPGYRTWLAEVCAAVRAEEGDVAARGLYFGLNIGPILMVVLALMKLLLAMSFIQSARWYPHSYVNVISMTDQAKGVAAKDLPMITSVSRLSRQDRRKDPMYVDALFHRIASGNAEIRKPLLVGHGLMTAILSCTFWIHGWSVSLFVGSVSWLLASAGLSLRYKKFGVDSVPAKDG